jgi:hypothetical protein
MFVGYYLLAVHSPYTIPNDGFHDLVEGENDFVPVFTSCTDFSIVEIPLGSLLKPVRPAAVSCRTHFLGRTMGMSLSKSILTIYTIKADIDFRRHASDVRTEECTLHDGSWILRQ